ncbi:MAG: nickel-dependent hydrogenase large subunit [Thiobacillus sp.]|nr:nickel-dependent hydrogenase large subunit [Thiobacillus sp.]
MSTDLEGRIDVRLTQQAGRITGVDIRSTRPQLARRLMAGRTPEEAADLAGMIFSLCGQAQRAAARAACDAALGKSTDSSDTIPVLMELAREHAWRLLLDWPQEVDQAPDMASLLALRQAPPEHFDASLETLLRETLLGEAPAAWLARDLAGLDAWARQGATLPARLFAHLIATLGEGPDTGISQAAWLPELSAWNPEMATALAHRTLADMAFCNLPDWRGAPAETGAIARSHRQPLVAEWIARRGRGMGARLLARLHELAELPYPMRTGGTRSLRAWSIGEGVGIAGVETSRGLLFHVASLHDGKVADYRILAPTEWNFHPAGPLAQALTGLDATTEDLNVQARLVSRSLDPCVAFGVEIESEPGNA